jgi:hypothetical protein
MLYVAGKPNVFKTRWFFEIEIIARWNNLNFDAIQIWEEPVTNWQDINGSKIKGKEILRIMYEFYKLQKIKGRSKKWI